jgi:hypothetical protein
MCRCDYGVCKDGCSCRCHVEGSSEMIAKLRAELLEVKAEKGMINEAWCNALHNNDIVDMVDAEGENKKTILLFVDEELERMRSKPA